MLDKYLLLGTVGYSVLFSATIVRNVIFAAFGYIFSWWSHFCDEVSLDSFPAKSYANILTAHHSKIFYSPIFLWSVGNIHLLPNNDKNQFLVRVVFCKSTWYLTCFEVLFHGASFKIIFLTAIDEDISLDTVKPYKVWIVNLWLGIFLLCFFSSCLYSGVFKFLSFHDLVTLQAPILVKSIK